MKIDVKELRDAALNCADHYADAPGSVCPETTVDLYRTIARLADALLQMSPIRTNETDE